MNLFKELKRRNVFRIAGIYAVVGWILMQVAGTLEESLNLPEWFDSVITAGLLIGFPVALLLAWAFEMTPEGVKPTESLAEENSSATSSKMDGLILVGIVAVLGMGAWQQINNDSGNSPIDKNTNQSIINKKESPTLDRYNGKKDAEIISPNSIAVLPFTDLSQAGDQEYFSDGMAEEIINVLVRVNALKVTSRTSAFQFKGSKKGIPEIAKQLKVRHVLEGAVRKSGNTLRITAQLIDAISDKHLWSDTFDRPLTTENIFAIQGEISNAILEALGEHLNLPSKIVVNQSTNNLTAYELYLKARPLFLYRKDLDVADQLLEQATNLDPKFAKAWEIRAALQSLMFSYNYTDKTVEYLNKRLFEFANKAIALEPNSATAIASKGLAMMDKMFKSIEIVDLTQMLSDFNSALKIEPQNASAHNWKGLLLQNGGFLEKALASFQACLDNEPFYAPCSENKEIVLAELGRDKEAIAHMLSTLNRGSRRTGSSPVLAAMARLDMEVLFKTATNHEALLIGWTKHDELYQAYKNPNDDHSNLLMEIKEHLKTNDNSVAQDIDIMLNPLGWIPLDNTLGIWDAINHRGRQSLEFKKFIRSSGIYNFWIKLGFPPQCRRLPDSKIENDFECD
ncbi:MAG: hypothetical protein COB38_03160 [Gammaproteobacteria bacterium]|nr:MAG: hypothetical protein COB38_03160 [Gammaproteobacteria bacterium]